MTRITVSGLPGSGTSTLCRRLAERTGLEHVNVGRIFRDLAAELGISLAELGSRAEADGGIDRRLDHRLTERARQAPGCLLEGRITGWMLHRHDLEALKLWVQADLATRARRVAGRDGLSPEEAETTILARERSERRRYADHHRIDLSDLSIYDLVLHSDRTDPEGLVRQVEPMLEGCG